MDPTELEYKTRNELKKIYWKTRKGAPAIAEAVAIELARRACGKKLKKFVKNGQNVEEDKPEDNPNQDRTQSL